ncbi:hypothetical protein BT93_I0050 [Corymbia citriodora subsp. variegata]|nr:hypothetical protein BT93_I0050 [Corymbia citriodora subsp. variegata]
MSPPIQVMYLWNLFTRKHKAVRRSGLEHRFVSMETAHMVLGFGFDARSNDYKIVRILYLDDNRRGRKAQVEIYMLRTDRWRSSECEVPSLCNDSAVFLNGNLHWFEDGHGSIVLFDVAGEVFDKMAPPEEISHLDADANVLVMSLAVLNDLLAVYISFIDPVMDPEQHSICSVWVMGEYGVPESWNKLYTFNPCGEVVGFDGFMRNGELLMEIYGGGRVSWNPITGQYANFPHVTRCNLVTVVESIVSL